MIAKEMEDILTVLAVGIFADKKVFASEIQVFTRSVSRVGLTTLDIPMLSGAQALMWYETNKDHIRGKFNGPRAEFDAWLIPILERVSDHADTEYLVKLIEQISLADQELHISEKALMVLVERIWDLSKVH